MKLTTLLSSVGRVGGITCFAMALGLTQGAFAQDSEHLAGKSLYGIDGGTGVMSRYNFNDGQVEEVGTVRLSGSETALTGIEASAYIPRSSNVMGFWTDPADSQTKLLYIDLKSAEATVLANDLGSGTITGAVAAMPVYNALLGANEKTPDADVRQYSVYAIQNPASFDFDIVDNVVKPQSSYVAKVSVLGAAIRSGSSDIPVTMKVTIGNTVYQPFGSYANTNGDVNDHNNPRRHILTETHDANTPIVVSAQSWYKGDSYIATASNAGSQQVKVLRNGDDVPKIDGFNGQNNIIHFVSDYLDGETGKVTLADNQVIYLFELGTTSMGSSAADFQDLVVLITLADEANDLSMHSDASDKARLVRIDHQTGHVTPLMDLDNNYDSLAALDARSFLATSGSDVYRINPTTGSELLLGSVSGNRHALEVAEKMVYGFDDNTDLLDAVHSYGVGAAGATHDLGLNDLRTIIFVRDADMPRFNPFD